MLNTKVVKERADGGGDEFNCKLDNNETKVRKCGYLKKSKSMKKKYFVLREGSNCCPSRLDYYGTEKKFRNSPSNVKRSIILKDCFSINRKCTSKSKFCIALYTNEDCVTLVFDNENEMNDWLQALLELQTGVGVDGSSRQILKPQYEHVWQVTLTKKGLGENRNMTGIYRLCLTAKSLLLFKVNPGVEKPESYEFPLVSIRRCGHSENYFVIELGRSSCIGPGELWILTEDTATSHNMHEVILAAMKSSKSHEDFGPVSRPRSASTSENSKPIATRRPTSGGITSPSSNIQPASITSSISYASITTTVPVRERCDSLPSRNRTVSDGTMASRSYVEARGGKQHDLRPYVGIYSRTLSYSPPASNNILSPSSTGCSTDSAGSSLSVDDYDSMTINGLSAYQDFYIPSSQHSRDTSAIPTEPPITEEESIPEDYLNMDPSAQSPTVNSSATVTNNSIQSQQQLRSSLNLSLQSQNYTSSSPVSSPTINSTVVNSQQEESSYIPMSPIGSTESTGYKSCSTRSSSIYERSSFSSDVSAAGYMPMAPGQIVGHETPSTSTSKQLPMDNEGYLDMAALSTSLPKSIDSGRQLGSSPKPAAFMPSLASTARKAEEFRLEKVKSYFMPTEDEESFDFIKPVRSYSMGSRPQTHSRALALSSKLPHNHSLSRTSRHPLPGGSSSGSSDNDAIRVRAYSAGSQSANANRGLRESGQHSIK
ncbi:Insulin receptor substrate 2-B-like protein [Dinothrombium tinctorium]|uniref:Insulin receptor substrate 1 n=1 Tax=Dinothrombium tinctorium TaxID=1965070 RepID=A0A443QTB6_9ACAR|nr:Insulin receptor substrate 2-B-like protein [Dinothrombium tinctorium]